LYTDLGIISSTPICRMCSEFQDMIILVPHGFGLSLFAATEPVNSHHGLSFHLHIQWWESQEDVRCICRTHAHDSSYTQIGQSLQLTSSALLILHLTLCHDTDITDNCGSSHHGVRVISTFVFSPQDLPNTPARVQNTLKAQFSISSKSVSCPSKEIESDSMALFLGVRVIGKEPVWLLRFTRNLYTLVATLTLTHMIYPMFENGV
jgi:hypothetical protein